MKKITSFIVAFLVCSAPLFASSDRILQEPSQPYASLGYLELNVPTSHSYAKYLTLGLMRKRAYQKMTRQLDKKLLKEARKKYGADAITHVTYWPAPDSKEPADLLYGRAEMIRFKKFPIPEAVPPVPQVQVESGTR